MATTGRELNANSLFAELLARFPATTRIETGSTSYQWLSQHAEDIDVHERHELPPDQIVLLDAESRRLVTVDVTHLRQRRK